MSALPIDDLPAPRPRALRFARPTWEGPPEPIWEPVSPSVYHRGAGAMPVPASLAPYVRDERHFARVIAAVADRAGDQGHSANRAYRRLSFHGERLTCAQDVLALLHDDSPRADGRASGLADPLAAELILLLFPPVRCQHCGREYLREYSRRLYCSDECRRAVSAVTQAARDRARRARAKERAR